ncbi:EAL domain-containing response regulator [Pseudoalteromonas sp. SS15]|uniref:EAL domain-containing response regulator n=1 Tax=Pseudoalteromonas sp. SS15 TaxID=3139393 RepID=UPI003BAD653E
MSFKTQRILVVDDSQAILMVMQAILAELGVEHVTCCESAQAALSQVEQQPKVFDAIFTDLNMPEMDGMELIRQLGQKGYQGGVIIISEMDRRIIDLASNLARQNHALLLGNIAKPIQLVEVERLLKKLSTLSRPQTEDGQLISEAELLHALSNSEITPFYQPKVNRATQQIESLEVLARIVSEQHGFTVLPARFIDVAEDLDLINLVTFQLFEKATAEYEALKEELPHPCQLAFNLSPIQLEDMNCPAKLSLLLELNHLQPSDIILEITEQKPLSSANQLETLNRLRMKGFEISLDDFGTGFTNINQLKSLPFTEIKIDRSLITHIDSDYFSQVITKSLVDLAIKEGFKVVAEGVERIEELQYLERYKHDLLMQGFLISRPKAKNELIRWIHSWLRMTNFNS